MAVMIPNKVARFFMAHGVLILRKLIRPNDFIIKSLVNTKTWHRTGSLFDDDNQ